SVQGAGVPCAADPGAVGAQLSIIAHCAQEAARAAIGLGETHRAVGASLTADLGGIALPVDQPVNVGFACVAGEAPIIADTAKFEIEAGFASGFRIGPAPRAAEIGGLDASRIGRAGGGAEPKRI